MFRQIAYARALKAHEYLTGNKPQTSTHRRNCPLRVRFGERLRDLRHSRLYTQQQLADYLGIDRSFLSDVERGKSNLSLHLVDAIAQGFHLSLADLLRDL